MIEELNKVRFGIDFGTLIRRVEDNVRTHASTELRRQNKGDKILSGFLNLTERVLRIAPELATGAE